MNPVKKNKTKTKTTKPKRRLQLVKSDPNFQSELNYDGYQSIVESDNDSYSSLDSERNENTPQEVKIEDREVDSDSGEEDLMDPQENRK